MKEVLIPSLTGLIMGLSGFVYGKRKNRAETRAIETKVLTDIIDAQNEYILNMENRLKAYQKDIQELRKEVENLKNQVKDQCTVCDYKQKFNKKTK